MGSIRAIDINIVAEATFVEEKWDVCGGILPIGSACEGKYFDAEP
ncbi:MAG: hypothetical protein ACI9Y1_002811 [Lentisphaeria bacterium]